MVPCGIVHKRPLPGVSGQKEYHMIAKGCSGRYGLIHGPYCQHSPYPPKINLFWCCEILFDLLMQNLYKVTQSNHEKVPFFATWLEGTLNQIQLQCPQRIMDWEVQQHLKDSLFHGVYKHFRDLIQHLYSNPRTTYSQLMMTACKVDSENEEAQDKVMARSAVTTKPV